MKRLTALLLSVAMVSGTASAAKPPHKHAGKKILPIAIVINGTRLAVNPPPRLYKDHLMVPVRRTVTALGLEFQKTGNRVTTNAGAKTIALTVGSAQAEVDGEPIALDAAPVEIANVLYAPLRFFTAALDAQAVYNRQTNSVEIISTLLGRSGNGIVSQGGGVEELGTVTWIDLDSAPPTVTVSYNASVRTLPVLLDATVIVQDVNTGTSNPGDLSDLRAGDYAHLYLDKNGHVKQIVDAYGSRTGIVAAVAGGEVVLDDGQVIAPSRASAITLNGAAASAAQIAVGDAVMVRYNIDSSEPREIFVTRKSAGTPPPTGRVAISRIDFEPSRPIRQGDKLYVTMRGTPGGLANYDLGPYVTNLSLTESVPGTYTGQYQVPRGVNFSNAPIFGHLNVRGRDAPKAESEALVSISTEPPGITDFAPDAGAVVNNPRPSIYATFSSGTVDVNPSSAQMEVNGHDVTSSSMRTARFIHFTPGIEYRDGPMRVSVRVSDLAGNTTVKTWSFFIKTR